MICWFGSASIAANLETIGYVDPPVASAKLGITCGFGPVVFPANLETIGYVNPPMTSTTLGMICELGFTVVSSKDFMI